MRILFVTWDGPGPNYHESLFLPILARARRSGDEVHLLQYGWDAEERTASVRAAARRLGMPYTARRVWRRPKAPATAAMIARGAGEIVRYARRHNVEVLMPRSLIPAGMALLATRALRGVKVLFDADGLMADERADFGGWSRDGAPYRILRAVERAAVRRADATITRTRRAKELLVERAGPEVDRRIRVVCNGKDAEVFHPGTAARRSEIRAELGLSEEAPLLVYAGSLGPQYHPDRIAALAAAVRARDARAHLLLLTGSTDRAREVCRAHMLEPGAYTARRVAPQEVAQYLAAADAGIAFRTPSLSQLAVAPVKVGEYLLCGVPVLSTRGIGDLEDQLDSATGRFLNALDDASLEAAAAWLTETVRPSRAAHRDRCRRRGLEEFSLERSAQQYRRAFEALRQRA
jgi:glycosyltransferase involved in cell wall biosynthesis